MALKQKVKAKMDDQKRVEFAKQLEYFYEASHADLKKVVTFSFLKGIATGLGVFLGGTIVVALLLWILSQLSWLPFVNDISRAAEHSIHENRQ